jgi:adiponectin receptor
LEKKLEKLEPVPDQQSKNSAETGSHHSSASSPHISSLDNTNGYASQNSELDFPIEDLRTWVRDSLDQLAHLRSEVSVRLPDLEDIRSHFPDFDFEFELPNVNLDEFRARLSRMEVPNLSSSLTDVKRQIGDLGYEYLPTLSEHLSGLHSQLKSLSLPNSSDFPSRTLDKGNAVLRDFIDALMYNEEDSPLEKTRVDLEVKQTVVQIHEALHSSMDGTRLITYEQLCVNNLKI